MTELEIRAFLAVINVGSISAAAAQLHVTQPALSRRIQVLENELGYILLKRHKGMRMVELTDEGAAFIPLAEKYLSLWQEAKDITRYDRNNLLNISSIGSISSYILPPVFSQFMTAHPDYRLNFHHYHSFEAYTYVSNGQIDMALISDEMYVKNVQTIPLFREKMLLVTNPGSRYANASHPNALDAADEIRLPWNPAYDLWHNFWFSPTVKPRVFLDQMSLMEYFITRTEAWAITPASAANYLQAHLSLAIHPILEAPPDRIIYYLCGKEEKQPILRNFLYILNSHLSRLDGIETFYRDRAAPAG